MLKAYIAGPLRDSHEFLIAANRNRAYQEACRLWKSGFAVLCPHLNTLNMIGLLEEEKTFIAGDLEWLRHADIAIFLADWENSEGAVLERDFCYRYQIPILEAPNTKIDAYISAKDGYEYSYKQIELIAEGELPLP